MVKQRILFRLITAFIKLTTSFHSSLHDKNIKVILHTCNKSCSFWYDKISQPTTGAHVLSVNTFLIKGSFSPCFITIFAIWITGSLSGSGNIPFLPAHSISKLSILSGAILSQSPKKYLSQNRSNFFKEELITRKP